MTENTEVEFVTYRKYNSFLDAVPLIDILKEAEIEFEIEDSSPSVDITFSANTSQDEFRIKIAQNKFEIVDNLIQNMTTQLLDQIDEDHYLFDFSDEELIEIFQKPDEWSNDDYVIARNILSKRGQQLSDAQLQEMRKKRIEFLMQPKPEPTKLIYTAWFFAFLGGLFGIFIGWYIKEFKRTLFNGQRVWEFDESTRNKGTKVMKVGLVIHIICLILFVVYLFSQAI